MNSAQRRKQKREHPHSIIIRTAEQEQYFKHDEKVHKAIDLNYKTFAAGPIWAKSVLETYNTPEKVKQRLEELADTVDPESGEKMMVYTATFPAELFRTMQGIKEYMDLKELKIIGSI
jgi:hypothetical protein